MILIGHRGKHNDGTEPNSMDALKAGLEQGYGIETDFRDYNGKLVLSHDRPGKEAVLADEFFDVAGRHLACTLAINVKSDGIGDLIKEEIDKHKITNYFAFDMSVPQMLEYYKLGVRFFTRQSEFEKSPVLYKEAAGVWLDTFENDDWLDEELVSRYIKEGKDVCIVSPELHGRVPDSLWDKIASWKVDTARLMLCTDLLEEAKMKLGRV